MFQEHVVLNSLCVVVDARHTVAVIMIALAYNQAIAALT